MMERLQELVWGPWMLAAFLGIGVYLTVRSGLFQLRRFPLWWRATGGSLWNGTNRNQTAETGGITTFQTACTALAATIGTGNIVGVATALTAGGPGAIFWMWVSAAIGMMTAYGETYLGVRYRRREGKMWVSGPMVYLEDRLHLPALGLLYSFLCMMSSLGMGSMVQANSVSETAAYSFSVPPFLSAVAVTVLVGLVVSGGTKRIAAVSGKLMPAASGIYILFSLMVIFSCFDRPPQVFAAIWSSAFEPAAAAGGAAGYLVSRSVRYGVSRGVFSNEAGLGTLAILHGAADEEESGGGVEPRKRPPAVSLAQKQGMWAMFEVFFDTIVICTLTALVILLVTAEYGGGGYDGAALTAYCFSRRLGAAGEYLVSASMIVFAFATMVAWSYMGKQAFLYLFSRTPFSGRAGERIYLILYLNAIFLGCLARLETVWQLSDIWNGLMALPNLAALYLLRREVAASIPEKFKTIP